MICCNFKGGKRWRSTLLLLIAEALGKSLEEVIDFVVITEVVHNGSLVIDDIEDDSEYRTYALYFTILNL